MLVAGVFSAFDNCQKEVCWVTTDMDGHVESGAPMRFPGRFAQEAAGNRDLELRRGVWAGGGNRGQYVVDAIAS